MDISQIPSSPPGEINITSPEGGSIRIALEPGAGADWRFYLTDSHGDSYTTEFTSSGARSPGVIRVISYGLRAIIDPNIDMSGFSLSDSDEGRRLSDQNQIVVTIKLVQNTVTVTLRSLTGIKNLDGINESSVTGPVDTTQREFFQRVIWAMERDNTEYPLENPQ